MTKKEVETLDIASLLGAVQEPQLQVLSIFIPNKDKNNKVIDNHKKWVKEAIDILSSIGGGATAMPPADGSWLNSETGNMILEKTTVIYSYVYPDKFKENMQNLRNFLHKFGRESNQGEVVFEWDNQFFKIRKYD